MVVTTVLAILVVHYVQILIFGRALNLVTRIAGLSGGLALAWQIYRKWR
jgi:hypothetical protein